MEGKTHFMIEIPHTKADCMQMLDDIKDKTPDILNNVEWGCMDNNHTGFAIVDANSKEEALQMLPDKERAMAKVTKLDKLTVKQIDDFHKETA
ncbi:MAG: hypothetical protein ACM3QX_17670 [Syntrophomonadaceae bacterium]